MYLWIKAFHVIFVICWMAGLFYLPRLFVYHAQKIDQKECTDMLEIMEQKLLRIIMNPSMILTYIFGFWLVLLVPDLMKQGWFHLKFLCVIILTIYHMMLARHRKQFLTSGPTKSERYFRIINEIPAVLLVVIVICVVVKPF